MNCSRDEPRAQMFIILLLVFGTVLLLSSCALYNKQYQNPPEDNPSFELYAVQADDFGSLWTVSAAQAVLDRVEQLAANQNLAVVVFIHGWHHNAKVTDLNFQEFRNLLERINGQLNQPSFTKLRESISRSPTTRVLGVYIGWRGRALPGVLDYLNMWWRKDAAERVGEGDVREFIIHLQRTYLRVNSLSNIAARGVGEIRPQMGLLTIGHSFGAQVLIKAVVEGLEGDLAERAGKQSDTLSFPYSPPSRLEERPIDTYGDLNILVNPAVEAYQFARISALDQAVDFPRCQLPQIMVISSDKDFPRRAFFPIARGLTLPFRPMFRRDGQQAELWSTALGMLASQNTHTVESGGSPPAPTFTQEDYESDEGRIRIRDWDFTSPTTFRAVTLAPKSSGAGRPNSPVIVATEPGRLIPNHVDIFSPDLWSFIVDYVSFLEGKRLLWRLQWLNGDPKDRYHCQ